MKTETKHTPTTAGPWVIEGRAIGSQGPDKYCPIARCVAMVTGDGESDKANARLIASAPAMLAALEAALTTLDGSGHLCVEQIRAAIALARP